MTGWKDRGFWAAANASIGSLLLGFSSASINSTVRPILITFETCRDQLEPWMSSYEACPAYVGCPKANSLLPWITSASLISATIGATFVGRFAKRGRRPNLIFALTVALVALILTSASNGMPALLAGRLVLGVAIGFFAFFVPLYITEIALPTRRAGYCGLSGISIVLGGLITSVLALMFYGSPNLPPNPRARCGAVGSSFRAQKCEAGETDGDRFCRFRQSEFDAFWWRVDIGSFMVPLAIIGISFLLFRFRLDTPYYYLENGNLEDAEDSLLLFRQQETRENIKKEIEEIQQSIHQSKIIERLSAQKGFIAIHKQWASTRALWTGIFVAVQSSITGAPALTYLLNFFFLQTGMEEQTANRVAVLVLFIKMVTSGVLLTTSLGRFGRRTMLIVGSFVQTVALLPATVYLWRVSTTGGTALGLMIGGASLFQIGTRLGYGAFANAYIFEMFPLEVRRTSTTTCVVAHWLAEVAVFFATPLLPVKWAFLIFTTTSLNAVLFTVLFIHETKHRRLGDTDYAPSRGGGPSPPVAPETCRPLPPPPAAIIGLGSQNQH